MALPHLVLNLFEVGVFEEFVVLLLFVDSTGVPAGTMRWTSRMIHRVFDTVFLVHEHLIVVRLDFQELSGLSVIDVDLRSRSHDTLGSYQTRITGESLVSSINLVFVVLRTHRLFTPIIHIR